MYTRRKRGSWPWSRTVKLANEVRAHDKANLGLDPEYVVVSPRERGSRVGLEIDQPASEEHAIRAWVRRRGTNPALLVPGNPAWLNNNGNCLQRRGSRST